MTTAGPEPFLDETAGEPCVRGFLHRASGPDGLVLTHGAGGNCEAPLLVSLAETFAAAGLTVLRCDLPFRQLRPHGPPMGAMGKTDQEGLRRAVDVLRRSVGGRVFLGGHSYGGRQASILASAAVGGCATQGLFEGLLLLSYPLHPPKKPSSLRTSHLPDLRIPAMFVHGTRDPFGSVQEMESAINLIPAPTKLFLVEGEGHSLVSKRNRAELPSAVLKAARAFFAIG
jgi:uncharacterized protein